MSCRSPINNGYDLAKLIHDQLITDLKNDHSPKVNNYSIRPNDDFLSFF